MIVAIDIISGKVPNPASQLSNSLRHMLLIIIIMKNEKRQAKNFPLPGMITFSPL
jgi:hypothetical protein